MKTYDCIEYYVELVEAHALMLEYPIANNRITTTRKETKT